MITQISWVYYHSNAIYTERSPNLNGLEVREMTLLCMLLMSRVLIMVYTRSSRQVTVECFIDTDGRWKIQSLIESCKTWQHSRTAPRILLTDLIRPTSNGYGWWIVWSSCIDYISYNNWCHISYLRYCSTYLIKSSNNE